MKMLLTLAWRNLWRNKKRSMITISSVLFAVLMAIVFESLERGSYQRMIDNMVKYSTGYMQIQDVLYNEEPSIDNTLLLDQELLNTLEKFDNKIDFSVPRIQNFALAATAKVTRGTFVMGIDPEIEGRLNRFSDDMIEGEFLTQNDADIVLGNGLAQILNLNVGDSLVLLGQGFQGSTAAGIFHVKGIVNIKLLEMSNNTIYMSIPTAQAFFNAAERLTALIVMPKNPRHTASLAKELNASVDSDWLAVLTWEELLKDLLALMQFDQAGSMLMMGILYLVITFGIMGTILTMMIERQREFGMLISLGMKRSRLAFVVFFEAFFISMVGVVVGILVAIPIVFYFYHNPIMLTGEMAGTMLEYGFEPIMPFAADLDIFLGQALIVLVIAILVGLYPIKKVFQLDIMKVKR